MNIEIKNIKYKYNEGLAGEVSALNGVSLNVGGPEFIALIGSTGSGKSTLIQMFDGLLRPTEGTVLFNGEDIYQSFSEDISADNGMTPGFSKKKKKKESSAQKQALRKIRKKVGIVFQYPESQLFEENILLDAAFGPKNLGFSAEEAKEKAKVALLHVGISEELFDKSPFELSGGEMRRVAIAGVLAMEPEILILDEPTAGLDPQGKIEILDQITKLQQQRNRSLKEGEEPMTVVFVSHNMEEVAEYADRVVAMHKGRILFDGTVKDAFANYLEFEKTGLKAPEVNYLCRELGIDGVITVEEAAEKIFDRYSEKA